MTDILDLPGTITFTLGRKDILRKLWSTYNPNNPSAHDHAHYFALAAALSLPENQEACYRKKMLAAFRSATNPVKLANGYVPYLYEHNYNGIRYACAMLRIALTDRAAGKPTSACAGFLSLAFSSVPIEALARALELLKSVNVLEE